MTSNPFEFTAAEKRESMSIEQPSSSSILMWEKPAKAMSTEKYQSISAEGAPPGVYVPNMSASDAYRWRAKLIGGKHPRVEIRKSVFYDGPEYVGQVKVRGTLYGDHAQVKIVVTEHRVRISTNGPINMSAEDFQHLQDAIDEARAALKRGKV